MSRYHFVAREPVDKGWSGDKKYRVMDAEGRSYLLRVSPAEQRGRKAQEFEIMREIEATGISMCRALEFGESDEGVYSVQTWIHGRDAEDVMASLDEKTQYEYGLDAGRMLVKIHSIPAPEDQTPWEKRFNAKMDRKIKMYRDCPLKYDNGGGEAFIRVIEENRHLLANRPQTLQHGDYHIGNMMIGDDGKLYVIDFNRFDYGDPWEEFNRIVWCAQKAPVFAAGLVDGYFGGAVPEEFWRLLAMYISSNTLSSLPWAIPFGEKEIAVMKNQAGEILGWYDGMREIVPGWYKENARS